MATLTFRTLGKPELLRCIEPNCLIAFLKPHQAFLTDRGITLPEKVISKADAEKHIDYEALTRVFLSPDDPLPKAPVPLIEAACIIDEMATASAMDALVDGAEQEKIDLGEGKDESPVDVAIRAWLADSEFVRRKHAEQYLERPRSFEYFPRAARTKKAPLAAEGALLRTIEKELDDWFDSHRRGRGSRVFVFARPASTWFLIRHGLPLRREGSLDNGKSSSVVYRPERFDVVVYDHILDELRINAETKGEKTLYRDVLGKRLLADSAYFGTAAKYTLDPIVVKGRGCLACEDVLGIEWVKLIEVQFPWGGQHREVEIRKATDIFGAYEDRNRSMPSHSRILKARFEVKFKDFKKTRKVSVSAHKTQFVRDEDTELVEKWLSTRGFSACNESAVEGADEEVSEVLGDPGIVAGIENKLRGVGVPAGLRVPVDRPATSDNGSAGSGAPRARQAS